MEMQPVIKTRRKFLQKLSLAPGLALIPAMDATASAPALPVSPAIADEEYWKLVRMQFAMPEGRIMVNAANLCPAPRALYEKVNSELSLLSSDVSFQHRQRFAESRKRSLELLARFLNVAKEEVGITRNTSEANCTIVNGLDLKAGEEVVIWEQNHPSCNEAWVQRARRAGFTVKKVSVPAQPTSAEELIEPFQRAVTSKTRLIAFSHISNTSGITLPAAAICQWARSKGVLTLVDGAQSFGVFDLNLAATGCDFYTASAHKWLMGPMENGILYVRRDLLPRVWPQVMGAGWKADAATVDEKLCTLGQRDDTSTIALPEAIEFQSRIGRKNIFERVLQLNQRLRKAVTSGIPQAELISPAGDLFSSVITIVSLPGHNAADLYQLLYAKHGIACAATGGLRFSPHVYNSLNDMDAVVEALAMN
jgi:selenocysteine lyase/cysteine desulfurase